MEAPPPSAHPRPHPGTGSGAVLWLVRHAEVREDWRGRAYGDLDVPLSRAGEARTDELARDLAALPPARVVSSPLVRARALGEAVAAGAGLALEVEHDLREIHRGRWQGRAVAELTRDAAEDVRAFYADPWRWCGHGGECDDALAARAVGVLDRLLAAPSAGPLVLTTHYNVVRVLLAAALGVPPDASFALRVDPGRAACLVDGPTGWVLVASNVHRPGVRVLS